MKKKLLVMMVGLLLIGVNAFAAGDLIVNGDLGVGVTPAYKMDIEKTDGTALRIKAIKTTGTWLNGTLLNLDVNSSNAGGNSLVVSTSHYTTGSTTGIIRGALYSSFLGGSGTVQRASGMNNSISIGSDAPYTIDTIQGNEMIINLSGSNTAVHTITNYYGISSLGGNAGSGAFNGTNWRHAYFQNWPDFGGTITNVAGLWIDQQTRGTNNYGIALNGTGAGADITFGNIGVAGQDARIYFDGSEIRAVDAAGNDTAISPHDPVTGEWVFYSKNINTGRIVKINMEKLVKAVEKMTGETFMVETLMESE